MKRHDFLAERSTLGQNPFAAILGCADSRVGAGYIFDTNEGELFVYRIAGNFADANSIVRELPYGHPKDYPATPIAES